MARGTTVSTSIQAVDLEMLDMLASRRGVTRSVVLRKAISTGLAVMLSGQPDLAGRYKAAKTAAIENMIRNRYGVDDAVSISL